MLARMMDELVAASSQSDMEQSLTTIRNIVPEYTPTANSDGGLTKSHIPPQHRAAVQRDADFVPQIA